MADPRKPVIQPDDGHRRDVTDIVHQHLLAATEIGAKAIGATGISFVIIGMGVWTTELMELDARAAAKYLRSLADIFDPATNENQKRRGEKARAQAVRALFATLDLEMAETIGHG